MEEEIGRIKERGEQQRLEAVARMEEADRRQREVEERLVDARDQVSSLLSDKNRLLKLLEESEENERLD